MRGAQTASATFGRIGVATSAKTAKGQETGYVTGILYLAPAGFGGTPDYCPHSTPGCRESCLFFSGRLGMGKGRAQVAKTLTFAADPKGFVDELIGDIGKAKSWARKRGLTLAIRLNGTSDLPWHRIKGTSGVSAIDAHPDIQFYDYTPNAQRMHDYLDGKLPANYHLTFSLKETLENHLDAAAILKRGGNVAVPLDVNRKDALPETWRERTMLDGDVTDHRFLDPQGGNWIGLRVKSGPGKHDSSGFIVRS